MIDRFLSKVIPEPNSGCWLWMSAINENGYGVFSRPPVNGKCKIEKAHRISYELHKGKIGSGLWIDHLCRNKCCVNPDHLEAVTPKESSRRIPNIGKWKREKRKFCSRGHPLDEGNVIMSSGSRLCRKCRNMYARERRRRIIANRG